MSKKSKTPAAPPVAKPEPPKAQLVAEILATLYRGALVNTREEWDNMAICLAADHGCAPEEIDTHAGRLGVRLPLPGAPSESRRTPEHELLALAYARLEREEALTEREAAYARDAARVARVEGANVAGAALDVAIAKAESEIRAQGTVVETPAKSFRKNFEAKQASKVAAVPVVTAPPVSRVSEQTTTYQPTVTKGSVVRIAFAMIGSAGNDAGLRRAANYIGTYVKPRVTEATLDKLRKAYGDRAKALRARC